MKMENPVTAHKDGVITGLAVEAERRHHPGHGARRDQMNHAIRKAVIPAAGIGSRLLPLTKAIPKECFRWATSR